MSAKMSTFESQTSFWWTSTCDSDAPFPNNYSGLAIFIPRTPIIYTFYTLPAQ